MITCFVSMPHLMSLRATLRRTGFSCSASYTTPIPLRRSHGGCGRDLCGQGLRFLCLEVVSGWPSAASSDDLDPARLTELQQIQAGLEWYNFRSGDSVVHCTHLFLEPGLLARFGLAAPLGTASRLGADVASPDGHRLDRRRPVPSRELPRRGRGLFDAIAQPQFSPTLSSKTRDGHPPHPFYAGDAFKIAP